MPRNKAYREEEALEKAMQVFWTNGYEATSVRLLEKEMGINQFSIYSSFKNKKLLFIESLKKYREHVKENRFGLLLQEDAGLQDLKDFFKDFVLAVRSGKSQKGCLVINTTGEMGNRDAEISIELKNYFAFIENMFYKLLQNARANQEIAQDAEIDKYANYLLGIMQGLSVGAKILEENQINDIINVTIKSIR